MKNRHIDIGDYNDNFDDVDYYQQKSKAPKIWVIVIITLLSLIVCFFI